MISYLTRRLFFMIPTLIGITFLVFMLIAMAPGGLAAALVMQGQEGGEAGAQAAIEAYLEERYGLNDPVLVQYARWLSRISPIKFGRRDQVDPNGSTIRPPKALDPPPLAGEWYAVGAVPGPPEPPAVEFASGEVRLEPGVGGVVSRWLAQPGDAIIEGQPVAEMRTDAGETVYVASAARGLLEPIVAEGGPIEPGGVVANLAPNAEGEYRSAEFDYARARTRFVVARKRVELALGAYAEAAGIENAVGERDKPRVERFRRAGADESLPEYRAVVEAGEEAVALYAEALDARARLVGVFNAGPFRGAGFWIVPGAVSVAAPDLGYSFARSRPASSIIAGALPTTLLLNAIAVPIIYFVAIPMGMLAATRRGSWIDVGSGVLFVALWSIPVVWAGVLAVGYLGSKQVLGDWAFPSAGLNSLGADGFTFLPTFEGGFHRGYLLDTLWHVALPVACLVYGGFAVLSKQTRAAMLDNFNADFVRTAKAKGVAPRDIVLRHVFRNSLLPLITMFATVFPFMLAGSVVVETIFSIDGMGRTLIQAIQLRDRELLLAIVVIVSVVNMLALLLADLLYALADPRITYD